MSYDNGYAEGKAKEKEYYNKVAEWEEKISVGLTLPEDILKSRSDEGLELLQEGAYEMTQELYDWTMEVIGEDNEGYMQSDSIGEMVYYDGEFFCGIDTIKRYFNDAGGDRAFLYGDAEDASRYEAILNLM